MTYVTKDWKDADSDGGGDHSTPTDAPAMEDLERRVGGAAGANSLLALGCVGNGGVASPTDDTVALQAALDLQRTNPVWLEGEAKIYSISQPLVLGPGAKLRQLQIRAAPTFAPADVNGAMLMNAQGSVFPFTASAATNVVTTSSPHLVPSDGGGVVVKGFTGGGLVSGRVYYARDRTTSSYKLGASRVFGRGIVANGSNVVTGLTVSWQSGTWQVGQSIQAAGGGIPAGTTVTAVGSGTLTMSANATVDATKSLTGVSTAVDVTADLAGTAYHEVLSLQKLQFEDVFVNGRDVANVNGAAFYLQQQSEFYKFRIDNCPGTGLRLAGQQSVFYDFESINCGTALGLEGASFMHFHVPNMEACNRAIHVVPAGTVFQATTGAFVSSFLGGHFEMRVGSGLSNATSTAVDIEAQCSELLFDVLQVSMTGLTQKVFHVHTGAPTESGYDIRSVRVSTGGPGANPIFMQDDDRGHTVDTWEDVVVNVGELKTTKQPGGLSYRDPGAHAVLLPGGGYVRFGPQNVAEPKLAIRAGSTQTGEMSVWRDSAGVDKVSIAGDGLLTATDVKFTGGAGVNRVLTSDADGDASWQALPSGSDVLALPNFQAGRYAYCGMGVLTTFGADELNRVCFIPILWALDREREIDRIGVLIATGGGLGSAVRFGLYADDGNMQPGSLITDFGTVSTVSPGWAEATISEVLLPGMYWAAVVAQGALPQWERLAPMTWGMLQADPTITGIGTYAQSPVSGSLTDPAVLTYPGSLRRHMPAVQVRMV